LRLAVRKMMLPDWSIRPDSSRRNTDLDIGVLVTGEIREGNTR
jgi:hypothetical protein